MREQEPMTQTMKISDVKNKLSSLVNEVYEEIRPEESDFFHAGTDSPGQREERVSS